MSLRNLSKNDIKNVNGKLVISGMNGQPGMLLVKADYCGYCTQFMPTYKQVAERIGNGAFQLLVLDSKQLTDFSTKSLGIQGYPTIKFVESSGHVNSAVYSGNRTVPDILDHICKFFHFCIKEASK